MMERPIGNDATLDRLKSLAVGGRLHPCLLFEGPVGVGKAAAAIWLACAANCEAEAAPCGKCWSCRQIPKGQHPDVLLVGVDPKKTTPIISVAQARALQKQLTVKPFHAAHRFVIIDPADAMTAEAANALLKTFEDPPSQTHFILLTGAPASLLLTVRSRSQRVRFAPVDEAVLVDWLSAKGVPNPESVARVAEGCPGRALRLDTDGIDAWRASRDALLSAFDDSVAGRLKYAENLTRGDRAKWAPKVDESLHALSALLRDALSVLDGGTVRYNDDRVDAVHRWADALGRPGLARSVAAVDHAQERLDRFVNGRLVMDALIAAIHEQLDQGGRHGAV